LTEPAPAVLTPHVPIPNVSEDVAVRHTDGAFHHESNGDDHPALVFAIAIAKVLSFDKQGGAATRHLPA
jgi:hypothetical protein